MANDITQTDLGWMEAIMKYLQIGKVPNDKKDLKCLNISEAQYVLTELHKEICGNHLNG